MKEVKKAAGFIGIGTKKISSKIASTNLGKKAVSAISSIGSKLKNTKISNVANKAKTIASSTANRLKDKGKQIASKTSEIASKKIAQVKTGVNKVANGISNTIDSNVKAIKNAANNFNRSMQRMCGMQPELAGGISFDDAVDAIEEVAPIKNNAKETFVNATSGNGDNAVGGNLSYQGATQAEVSQMSRKEAFRQAKQDAGIPKSS